MTDTFVTRHTVSGVIDKNTPRILVEHSYFGKFLEVVDEDAKPFLPEMHKPSVIDEPAPVAKIPKPSETRAVDHKEESKS